MNQIEPLRSPGPESLVPGRLTRLMPDRSGRMSQVTARFTPLSCFHSPLFSWIALPGKDDFLSGRVGPAMLGPAQDGKVKMAFVKPDIQGKEVQIAAAFHVREEPKEDPLMPPVLLALVNNDKPDVLATAYGPVEPDYAATSPFESLLKDGTADAGRFIPPQAKGDHNWVATALPPTVFSEQEQRCLAAAVYFEARGESVKGQAAVAQVVLNRVRNPAYPKSICGVVYQNMKWRNRCQFSFACDRIKDRIASPEHYAIAQDVALAVTAGKIWLPEVGSSTHYYADYVSPRWARAMQRMKQIGRHIFYRTYGGGWS